MSVVGVCFICQWVVILILLEMFDDFCLVQELYDELCWCGENIGLIIVYCILQLMVFFGLVDILCIDIGELVYCRCLEYYYYYLVCCSCGFIIEVGDYEVEVWVVEVVIKYGFFDVSYIIEIFGICLDCWSQDIIEVE